MNKIAAQPSTPGAVDQYIENIYADAKTIFDIGRDEKGECTALTYSKRLHERTEFVRKRMTELGMETRYDSVANLYGVLPGRSTDKKIMITSHVDSVFNAGQYDGVLGILLGIELVRYMRDHNITPQHSIEIMVCMGEESPGLTATFGSKVVTGHYTKDSLSKMKMPWGNGASLPEVINTYFREYLGMKDYQFENVDLNDVILDPEAYVAALEVHIEQFFLLQDMAKKYKNMPCIGAMRGVGGHLRELVYINATDLHINEQPVKQQYNLLFNGSGGHSGATPMGAKYRDDAAVKAANFILNLYFNADKSAISINKFHIQQPSRTSIPAHVEVGVNIHTADENQQKELFDYIQSTLICGEIVLDDSSTAPDRVIGHEVMLSTARLIRKMDIAANNALESDEVRGTITTVDFTDAHHSVLYADIRGGEHEAMHVAFQETIQNAVPDKVSLKTKLVSEKKPVKFDKKIMTLTEKILEEDFPGRVMKGHISVPGQDIGNISSHGIPSSLLFVESGTGHHPHEYVREEAMHMTFQAVISLISKWDITLNT